MRTGRHLWRRCVSVNVRDCWFMGVFDRRNQENHGNLTQVLCLYRKGAKARGSRYSGVYWSQVMVVSLCSRSGDKRYLQPASLNKCSTPKHCPHLQVFAFRINPYVRNKQYFFHLLCGTLSKITIQCLFILSWKAWKTGFNCPLSQNNAKRYIFASVSFKLFSRTCVLK